MKKGLTKTVIIGIVCIATIALSGCVSDEVRIGGGKTSHFIRCSFYHVTRSGSEGYEIQPHKVYSTTGDEGVGIQTGVRHWAVLKKGLEAPAHGSIIEAVVVYDGSSPFAGNPHMPQYQWKITDYERVR